MILGTWKKQIVTRTKSTILFSKIFLITIQNSSIDVNSMFSKGLLFGKLRNNIKCTACKKVQRELAISLKCVETIGKFVSHHGFLQVQDSLSATLDVRQAAKKKIQS